MTIEAELRTERAPMIDGLIARELTDEGYASPTP